MVTALLMGIGAYAAIDKWKQGEGFRLENVFDVIFNLAFVMIIVGGVIFIVSFAGCIGALRENMCLLRSVSTSTTDYHDCWRSQYRVKVNGGVHVEIYC